MHRMLGSFFLALGVTFLFGMILILTESFSDAFQATATAAVSFFTIVLGIALLLKSGEQ